jgi:hypothetical protein
VARVHECTIFGREFASDSDAEVLLREVITSMHIIIGFEGGRRKMETKLSHEQLIEIPAHHIHN